jgi:hypothetical protein
MQRQRTLQVRQKHTRSEFRCAQLRHGRCSHPSAAACNAPAAADQLHSRCCPHARTRHALSSAISFEQRSSGGNAPPPATTPTATAVMRRQRQRAGITGPGMRAQYAAGLASARHPGARLMRRLHHAMCRPAAARQVRRATTGRVRKGRVTPVLRHHARRAPQQLRQRATEAAKGGGARRKPQPESACRVAKQHRRQHLQRLRL